MNFLKNLFKKKSDNKSTQPVEISYPDLEVMNFQFLYNNHPYDPSIKLNYNKLKKCLPLHFQCSTHWNLAYGTLKHGHSLKSMHMFMQNYKPPFLIIIEDSNLQVFGVFIENDLRIKSGAFGYNTAFMFKIVDGDFRVYNALDQYVCYSTSEFIAFGCSDGLYGLYINKDMLKGQSNRVKSFENEVLASGKHFFVRYVEIWAISM